MPGMCPLASEHVTYLTDTKKTRRVVCRQCMSGKPDPDWPKPCMSRRV